MSGPEDLSDEVQYITQIGTGNYNEKTACLYTDLSLMTADTEIAKEARRVFQALAMGEIVEHTDKLLVAPLCLQNKVLAMIDDEIAAALAGKDAYIGLKMNALTDKKIIDRLSDPGRKRCNGKYSCDQHCRKISGTFENLYFRK